MSAPNLVNLAAQQLDNIIIDPTTLQVMLIDFNLSTFYHPTVPLHEPVQTQQGCINYSSPQILETAIYPERGGYYAERGWSDLWACGVVMYGMLVGFFPFRSQTPRKLYSEILKLEKKPLEWLDSEHVSQASRRFVEKLLNPRLVGRLTAGELVSDPYMANVVLPTEDAWFESAHTESAVDSIPEGSPFAPPASLPLELRKFWTINQAGVSPEMTSEDLDVQFFAVRRAMFDMQGTEPPQCVLEQERMVLGELLSEDADMDDRTSLNSSRKSTDWATPGPHAPTLSASSDTLGVGVVQARNMSAGSDRTAVRLGEEGDSHHNASSTSSEKTATNASRSSGAAKVQNWKMSHKSKMTIGRMVRNHFQKVKEAVQDWKKGGGKGLTGISGEIEDVVSPPKAPSSKCPW
ncbi:hypothetical protein HDU93_006244 [Gonapodya sp. JEL0774]|nr:hypothetical protein HDU93_006244 [Gonapodya sp. JEL0774]